MKRLFRSAIALAALALQGPPRRPQRRLRPTFSSSARLPSRSLWTRIR